MLFTHFFSIFFIAGGKLKKSERSDRKIYFHSLQQKKNLKVLRYRAKIEKRKRERERDRESTRVRIEMQSISLLRNLR